MPVDSQSVDCGTCGMPLEEEPSLPVDARSPCPQCGSTARAFHVTIHEKVVARSKLGMKGRHPGGHKPFTEQAAGDDFHRKSGKWMKLSRVIDRESDLYHELVTDPETGEIIHECKEPLTQHQGHGAAKHKKKPTSG